MPPLHDRLVTFSTFSKAWGLAALRIGWLASTAATCREIRKVKLPYSLNVISESIAAMALEHRAVRDANVALIIDERERMLAEMRAMPRGSCSIAPNCRARKSTRSLSDRCSPRRSRPTWPAK